MLKIVSIIVLSILFVGCSTTKKPQVNKTSHKHKMFQSVNPKDATLTQSGKNKNSCAICGMNLTKFYKTSHTVVYENKNVQYCSIHCLADHLEKGIEVKNPRVVDVTSLKFIPVLEAYYVVGSKVRGTMSRVSKYAFSSIEDAKKFQATYGGKIVDFNAALEVAQEDF